jgi:hypothetical protein
VLMVKLRGLQNFGHRNQGFRVCDGGDDLPCTRSWCRGCPARAQQAKGSGGRDSRLGSRDSRLGLGVQDLGVQGLGFMVSRCGVKRLGFRV